MSKAFEASFSSIISFSFSCYTGLEIFCRILSSPAIWNDKAKKEEYTQKYLM